jgi:small GTP-binding protein
MSFSEQRSSYSQMAQDSFRIVVLGSGGVGKTCVILRFLRDTFDSDYVPTIQDSFEKTYAYGGKTYKLNIVDTAGQDEMESINNLAVKSADAFVLLYACTSSMSFGELDKYKTQIYNNSTTGTPKIVIGGNKCDMDDERAVTTEQGRAKCQELGVPFFECSAKANIKIADMFEASLKQLLGVEGGDKKGGGGGGGGAPKEGGGGGCCEVA